MLLPNQISDATLPIYILVVFNYFVLFSKLDSVLKYILMSFF